MRAQLYTAGGGSASVAHSARYWWTKAIAMLPSPTPEATRLMEPWRTSPAAKTPATLVSNRKGRRSWPHWPVSVASRPVRM